MRTLRYTARRLLILVPQVLGVLTVTFIVIRLLPGDPARLAAGPVASPEALASLREQLGTDKPILVQYVNYLRDLLHGDLGVSWYTSNPVTADLFDRIPATLELITYSLVIALVVGLVGGILIALRPASAVDRASYGYGLFAGAVPEFWWALMLIFVFVVQLHILPAPVGRLDIAATPPSNITGFYAIDSLITLDWVAFRSSVAHLALPVATLAFVACGPFLKLTRQTMAGVLESEQIRYAQALGLSRGVVTRRALRLALPPVVTLAGVIYGYLIGGAVLIETVFSWGGFGQYAVQGVVNGDYAAIQGTVLFAAAFSLLVYLAVDLVHFALDPRIEH